jgi:ABC-type glycerol-3-phosphate transport system substrate-binding protein
VLIDAAKLKGFDYDVFLPPKHPQTGSRVIDVEANGLAITMTSKRVDDAWTFINWYTYGDGLPVLMQNIAGFIPPHIPTADKYVFTKDRPTPPKSLYLYSDLFKQGRPAFQVAGAGDIAPILAKQQAMAFQGAITADAAATTIEAQVTAFLNQEKSSLGL